MTEQQVKNYLEKNPNFFKNHSELLHKVQLSFSKGLTSSLVEKKITQLTNENNKLIKSAKEFLKISNENVRFSQQVHQFSLEIFKLSNFDDYINYLKEKFIESFKLDDISFYAFNNNKNIKKINTLSDIYRFFKEGRVYYATKQHLNLNNFCGVKTQSIAIINIGKNENHLMMIIESYDKNRFTPDKDHFFINNLQQIMDYKLDELTK